MRYLGSQMAARHADPEPTAAQAITLHYLRVAREMGLADEGERLTRDPGAKYEPRAVLALLATDPPPPAAAPSTLGEARAYDPNPTPTPNLTPTPTPNLTPSPNPSPNPNPTP